VPRPLNPLDRLFRRRLAKRNTDKLYGVIVAQARLPVFYRNFGVPDTVDGRFVVLSLHLFALLHRLKQEGAPGRELAQQLMNRFARDMETVLREVGIGDLAIPKKVRGIAASSHALLQAYNAALQAGDAAFDDAIAEALPTDPKRAEAASRALASYVKGIVKELERQSFDGLCAGELHFAEIDEQPWTRRKKRRA
jgi:cytochrome b pre-mRNA-processing protein 3